MATVDFIYGHHERDDIDDLKLDLERGEIGVDKTGKYLVYKGYDDVFIHIPFLESANVFNVMRYGAKGDGTTDDSTAILATFNACRTAGSGIVEFPKATYIVSYGFWIPDNIVIRLNGSTIKASTTYAMGTIPTNGTPSAMFLIAGSLAQESLSRDYANYAIIGDGATLDGNILNHLTPETDVPGYSGIGIETSDGQIEANYLRVRNVLVTDVHILRVRHYGIYSQNVENVTIRNTVVSQAGANGVSVISGKNVTMDRVHATHTRGPNPEDTSYGGGFWHETTRSWHKLENITHRDCYAAYNYGSGFIFCNNGQDCDTDVSAIRCKSYKNSWDTATQAYRSYTPAAGFFAGLGADYVARHHIDVTDCIAMEEYQAGFKVQRFTGGQTKSRVRFNNCVAVHCNQHNSDSYERAAFSLVGSGAANPVCVKVEYNSPTIIAPPANTLGYLIGAQYSQNVFLRNPKYEGPATYNFVAGNLPTNRLTSGVPNAEFDFGSDTKSGILGAAPNFLAPVRLATFDQTAEPTDIHTNEAIVWKDDNDQFTLIFKDSLGTKRYLDLPETKVWRASTSYAGAALAAGDVTGANVTVTGVTMGMHVKASYSANLNNGGSGPELFAFVSAADTVRWVIANHATVSRTILAGTIYLQIEDIT